MHVVNSITGNVSPCQHVCFILNWLCTFECSLGVECFLYRFLPKPANKFQVSRICTVPSLEYLLEYFRRFESLYNLNAFGPIRSRHSGLCCMNRIKIVLVGETKTGKTALCYRYAEGSWVNYDYNLQTWPKSDLDEGKRTSLSAHVVLLLNIMYVCWHSKMELKITPSGWRGIGNFRGLIWHAWSQRRCWCFWMCLCGSFVFSGTFHAEGEKVFSSEKFFSSRCELGML